MHRTLLVAFLFMILGAGPGLAQPADDTIYIGAPGSPQYQACVGQEIQLTIGFLSGGPVASGVTDGATVSGMTGAEFQIVGLPAGWTATAVPNPGASVVVGSPLTGGVDIVFPDCHVEPDVALYTLIITPTTNEVANLSITQHQSPSNPNYPCPLVILCDAPVFTKVCVTGGTATITTCEIDPCSSDTTPPTITCPANTTVECGTSPDPGITGSATAEDECDGPLEPGFADVVTGGPGAGATITRTWTAMDAAGNTASCVQTIQVVDTTAPNLNCPNNAQIDCTESTLPSNTGMPRCIDRCDPNPRLAFRDEVAAGPCPGTRTISRTFTCTDAAGNSASCTQTITIVDQTPPELEVVLDHTELWPPNHKMVEISADVRVTDCDGTATATLVSIESNEPDNGLGDGDTDNDIEILSNTTFRLRSERSGGGDGRIYTVTYSVMDCSGNETTVQTEVIVPHDQGGVAAVAYGFETEGTSFDSAATQYGLVIRGLYDFDVRNVDLSRVFVGNHLDHIAPIQHSFRDIDGDRRTDLVLVYDTGATRNLLDMAAQEMTTGGKLKKSKENLTNTVALRYQTDADVAYLVDDIFNLGLPLDVGNGGNGDGIDDLPAFVDGSGPLAFNMPEGGEVTIDVFTVQGRKVRTLLSSYVGAGEHTFSWDGRTDAGGRAASGIYFYRLTTPENVLVRKVVLTH